MFGHSRERSLPSRRPFHQSGNNAIEAVIQPPRTVICGSYSSSGDEQGNITRSWPGGPPNGKSIAQVLKMLRVAQNGQPLPVDISYDKLVWSGLSWGSGEVRHPYLAAGAPITIRCSSAETGLVKLEAHLYAVTY